MNRNGMAKGEKKSHKNLYKNDISSKYKVFVYYFGGKVW
jgi:hypothetical protein